MKTFGVVFTHLLTCHVDFVPQGSHSTVQYAPVDGQKALCTICTANLLNACVCLCSGDGAQGRRRGMCQDRDTGLSDVKKTFRDTKC